MKIYSIKTKYAYHLILWFILICFKIIIDYSIFKRIDILNNLRFFSTSFVIFYVNYIYFIPFLLKQKKEVIIVVMVGRKFRPFFMLSFKNLVGISSSKND